MYLRILSINIFSLPCALLSNQCGKKRPSGGLGPGIWWFQAQCSTEMVPEEDTRLCGKGQRQPTSSWPWAVVVLCQYMFYVCLCLVGQYACNYHLSILLGRAARERLIFVHYPKAPWQRGKCNWKTICTPPTKCMATCRAASPEGRGPFPLVRVLLTTGSWALNAMEIAMRPKEFSQQGFIGAYALIPQAWGRKHRRGRILWLSPWNELVGIFFIKQSAGIDIKVENVDGAG